MPTYLLPPIPYGGAPYGKSIYFLPSSETNDSICASKPVAFWAPSLNVTF